MLRDAPEVFYEVACFKRLKQHVCPTKLPSQHSSKAHSCEGSCMLLVALLRALVLFYVRCMCAQFGAMVGGECKSGILYAGSSLVLFKQHLYARIVRGLRGNPVVALASSSTRNIAAAGAVASAAPAGLAAVAEAGDATARIELAEQGIAPTAGAAQTSDEAVAAAPEAAAAPSSDDERRV